MNWPPPAPNAVYSAWTPPSRAGRPAPSKASSPSWWVARPKRSRRVEPLIRCYAGTVRMMGDAGCGQLTKMVNQIAIAGLVQGLAEALNFALRAGLDTRRAVEVISQGAAQSWQMDNRWETMTAGEFEFGFAVEWMRKDLRICLQEARRNGAELPVAALVDQFYADVEGMGGGRWDTSSLIARLNRNQSR